MAVAKFKLEPDAQVSGVYPGGEAWVVKFDHAGTVSTNDEHIAAALESNDAVKVVTEKKAEK